MRRISPLLKIPGIILQLRATFSSFFLDKLKNGRSETRLFKGLTQASNRA
jgi:hypothetical protein